MSGNDWSQGARHKHTPICATHGSRQPGVVHSSTSMPCAMVPIAGIRGRDLLACDADPLRCARCGAHVAVRTQMGHVRKRFLARRVSCAIVRPGSSAPARVEYRSRGPGRSGVAAVLSRPVEAPLPSPDSSQLFWYVVASVKRYPVWEVFGVLLLVPYCMRYSTRRYPGYSEPHGGIF